MQSDPSKSFLSNMLGRSDVLVSSSIILVLMIMIVPIPPAALDFLLAASISLSLLVLLVAFYTLKPLEFAVFPGMLLILTLFRLSLNIATTRLILGEAYAGEVIQAFGSFMVQGNLVIGIIIFAVLVIINFIVITKGATRIAEVAARFTLDAMPGKQMAIDADLNAGLLTEQEARKRRDEISRESDFYGAMDGASKFVRGDVVASLLITFINIIGGLIIGTMQQGMSIGDAARIYSMLTIGDGLVSQIPALLISTGAGIIVTRAAAEGNLGNEIRTQLTGNPRTLALASVFVIIIGLIPGLPIFPFLAISGLMLYGSWTLNKKQMEEDEIRNEVSAVSTDEPEKIEEFLLIDVLEIEIGYSLIPVVETEHGGDLLERVSSLRRQLAIELGIVLPPIRIRDNVQLESNEYTLRMRGVELGKGELLPGYHLALIPSGFDIELQGIKTKDPTFGMDAVWVNKNNKSQAEKYGLTIIEAGAVVTTHLSEVVKRNAHKLIDRQMTHKLIENVKETAPALVSELIPDGLKLGEVQKVLKKLLREKVPVRDLITILETLADYQSQTKNCDVLTEYVRAALSDTITSQYKDFEGNVQVVVLSSDLESRLLNSAQQGSLSSSTLGLTPDQVEKLYITCSKSFEKMIKQDLEPVLLTSPVLRATIYDFLNPVLPDVAVLSYNDISLDTQIKKFDRVVLEHQITETATMP
ncbi:MAG: flagellar biosynthesis protein FlhA [Balneolaceae bacterium]|nr:MAG: flagellar biosynthesis protein FlhA [Balneolaceae bacterium]